MASINEIKNDKKLCNTTPLSPAKLNLLKEKKIKIKFNMSTICVRLHMISKSNQSYSIVLCTHTL